MNGTVWNQDFKICDHKSNVDGCKSGSKKRKEPSKCINGTYYPHESDCAKFYQCGPTGKRVEKTCAPGTAWNATQKICDHISNLGCKGSCTLNKFYNHPLDCKKFYQCGPAGKVLKTCPSGRAWDPRFHTCDHEANLVFKCTTGVNPQECTLGSYSLTDPASCTPKYMQCSNTLKWIHRKCKPGDAFDPKTYKCMIMASLPRCSQYG